MDIGARVCRGAVAVSPHPLDGDATGEARAGRKKYLPLRTGPTETFSVDATEVLREVAAVGLSVGRGSEKG